MEASGCYGRNGADDVAADAALLARAVGAPVRVQLTREQEHAWEPKGAAQLMQVRGGLDARQRTVSQPTTSRPRTRATRAPTLALLLTRTIEPGGRSAFEMGDRTARAARTPTRNLRVTGQRHGADRPRIVVARRVGAAELVRARVATSTSSPLRRASIRSPSDCAI